MGTLIKSGKNEPRISWITRLSFAVWTMGFATPAFAAGGATPAAMVQNVCDFILGPFGKSLAVLGIIAIGVSWMFGRASLGLVAGVVGGIVIMFGAAFLGGMITGA
nr:pilin major subunit VirB2 [Phyllobacterium myrsinacearum]